MRKTSLVCVGIVSIVLWGYGQGRRDDHNDNSPAQSGYAIVTPAGGVSGLVVFETFGFNRGNETTQAGILPSEMSTSALMFVNSNGRLSRNLGVAIANPGSAEASVTLTLRDETGRTLGTRTLPVAAGSHTAQFVTEMFRDQQSVPSDVTGALQITSTTPVALVGLRFRGVNFSTLPVTNLSAPTPVPTRGQGIGGAGAVILAQFAAGGGWATEIVIANSTGASVDARVDLFKADGTALTATLNGTSASSFRVTVPANGVAVLAPRDASGDSRF